MHDLHEKPTFRGLARKMRGRAYNNEKPLGMMSKGLLWSDLILVILLQFSASQRCGLPVR